jgi:hypothetical protein
MFDDYIVIGFLSAEGEDYIPGIPEPPPPSEPPKTEPPKLVESPRQDIQIPPLPNWALWLIAAAVVFVLIRR